MPGKAALVTGAGGGLGREIARRLSGDGFRVACADLDEAAAGEVAAQIGGDSHAVRIDVGDEASAVAGVRAVAEKYGRLDGLVNCAGIHMQAVVAKTAADDWDRIHRVNARGTFLMCREAARVMVAQRTGRIVNIITKLGFGNPYSAAYMASKCAVWGLTQCLAAELARAGVTVNAVAPGHVGPGTGMEAAFRAKADKLGMPWDEFERAVLAAIPVGRWCAPRDVAASVAFLMRDEAGFVTGEIINTTGGFCGYSVAPPPEESQADSA